MSAETFPRPTGTLSARTKGVELILRDRAKHARQAALEVPDQDSQQAAALRGKARGYDEAAALVSRLERGRLLGFHKWTRKAAR